MFLQSKELRNQVWDLFDHSRLEGGRIKLKKKNDYDENDYYSNRIEMKTVHHS